MHQKSSQTHQTQSTPLDGTRGARFGVHQKLSAHSALRFDAQRCISAVFPEVNCQSCFDACPAEALSWDESMLALSDQCQQCGQCVASCPTGALGLTGFGLPDTKHLEGIAVDCLRVPARDRGDHHWTVPCIFGLPDHALLSLANEKPVSLLDRGWCAACPSSNANADLAAITERINALLASAGATPSVAVVLAPLPENKRIEPAPDPTLSRSTSRRGFFKALVADCSRVSDSCEQSSSVQIGDHRARILPQNRLQSLQVLTEIARRQHRSELDSVLFPSIAIDHERCCDQGMCAATCPTGALQRSQQASQATLAFNADLCIACGYCQSACPEQALIMRPTGGVVGLTVLNQHLLDECSRCGALFAQRLSDAGNGLPECPQCAKTSRVARLGAASLFG